jgi:hypothetical protein
MAGQLVAGGIQLVLVGSNDDRATQESGFHLEVGNIGLLLHNLNP